MAESTNNTGITRYTILDEDKMPFQAWRTKASAILDAEDCLDLCDGTEKESAAVLPDFDSDDGLENEADQRDPAKMWTKLHDDYDRITPELRQLSKQRLNSFKINEKDSVRQIKDKFMSIVRAA